METGGDLVICARLLPFTVRPVVEYLPLARLLPLCPQPAQLRLEFLALGARIARPHPGLDMANLLLDLVAFSLLADVFSVDGVRGHYEDDQQASSNHRLVFHNRQVVEHPAIGGEWRVTNSVILR